MIRRVFVDGYKSLRNVELELHPLTVVVGPNASGKSNLFDVLKLLSRIVTSRSIQEAFADHRGDPLEAFDCSEGGIARLLEKEIARFTVEVDVELSPEVIEQTEQLVQRYRVMGKEGAGNSRSKPQRVTERFLRYRITVSISPKTGVLRVEDEYLGALKQNKDGSLRQGERRRPFIEKVGDRLRLRMEGQARPMEYEIGLSYAVASQPVHPPHYPHLVAFREEVSRWQFYYFEPRLMREENPLKEVHVLTTFGGDMAAFYYTLKRTHQGQFRNLEKTLQTIVPTVEGIDVEVTQEGRLRMKVREHGVEYSAKVISEGTLRLLGVMAILSPLNPASVVGFEEPENGVHPRRLKLIADLLRNAATKDRQVIVNTHSPLLPDYLKDAWLIQCSKEDGRSVFEPLLHAEGLFRRPAIEEALEEVTPVSQRILRGDWE
jgi:predicted ATPase